MAVLLISDSFLQVSEIEEIEEDTIGDYEDDAFEEPSDEDFFDDPSIGSDHSFRNRRRRGEFKFQKIMFCSVPNLNMISNLRIST